MNEAEFLREMGKKVRQVRKSKRVTGDVMAKLTDKDRCSLYDLENGRKNCHILTLYKIAQALDVDIKTFL